MSYKEPSSFVIAITMQSKNPYDNESATIQILMFFSTTSVGLTEDYYLTSKISGRKMHSHCT